MQYENTEDVTLEFYWISCSGMTLLLVGALMYYVQSKEEMFDYMRPYIILLNLTTLVWFGALQYFRLKDTGRACSGDFHYGSWLVLPVESIGPTNAQSTN